MIGEPIYFNDSWLKSLRTALMYSLLSDAKRGSFQKEAGYSRPASASCLRNSGVSSRLQEDHPETEVVILLFVYAVVVATSWPRGRGQPLCLPGRPCLPHHTWALPQTAFLPAFKGPGGPGRVGSISLFFTPFLPPHQGVGVFGGCQC